MRKILDFLKNEKGFLISLLVMIIGIAIGDTSVLMAEGVTIAPNAPEDGTASEGSEGLNTQMNGQSGSVTNLERGGETADIIAEEIDDDIAKFRPDFFPIDTIVRKAARKKTVKNYEVKHFNIDSSRIECTTNS